MELTVKDPGRITSNSVSVFFVPQEHWPGEPLYYNQPEIGKRNEITGIPPGTYYLFAIEARNPEIIDAVGFPHLQSVYENYQKDERVKLLGLFYQKKNVNDSKKYLAIQGLLWPQTFLPGGREDPLATRYGIRRWPSIILIGPDGKVIARNLRGKAIQWTIEKNIVLLP